MKIAVISDTHGSLVSWKAVEPFLDGVQLLLHCGDIFYSGPRNAMPDAYAPGSLHEALAALPFPVIAARGNCDSDVDQSVCAFPLSSPFAFTVIDNARILVTHGNHYNADEEFSLAEQWKIDLFISGHTHTALLERRDERVFFNPGSLSLPKNFPGFGIIDRRSVTLYNLSDGRPVHTLSF